MISSVIGALLRREKPALTAGKQMWDYLYTDDAVEVLFCAASAGRDGKTYPIGSGQVRPLQDYIEDLRDSIDPDLPLGFGEIPYGEKQVMHLQADILSLTQDTGRKPKVSFSVGIKKTID